MTILFISFFTEKVAIKILDKNKLDEKTQKMLTREISCMERLQHPNLIRMFEVLETVDNLYMVLEYASCGELFHKIVNQGKFSESISRSYFSQLLSAVQHMVSHLNFLYFFLLYFITK